MGLPAVADEGMEKDEYASIKALFSRFFERPSVRPGKLKKSTFQQQQSSQGVSELVELEKDRPRLPPLITRAHTSTWSSGQATEYTMYTDKNDPDLQLLTAQGATGSTGNAGPAADASSPRSPSPRSPSPKQRFFMYEK